MISALQEEQVVRNFSEIQPGMLLTGYVRNVMHFGVFVEFPFGVTGLAPKVVSHAFTCLRKTACIISQKRLKCFLSKVGGNSSVGWSCICTASLSGIKTAFNLVFLFTSKMKKMT